MSRYSILDYGRFMADPIRTDAYARALQHTVKPDSIVIDIGSGTGIFAMLACKFGARRVYAIESDDILQVAREIAAANGYAERIEFIQDVSTSVVLSERADVIVSDLRGVLPWFQRHLPSIVDARRRLLAPGGVLIPQCDALWAAVVEAPDLYKRRTGPWDDHRYGFDMQTARRIVANKFYRSRVAPEQLLVEPLCGARLDYGTVENPDVLRAEFAWTAARTGTAHGLAVWFDATLAEDIHFSNAPGEPELIYGQAFFPWLEPVSLAAGDKASALLQADFVGEDYTWRWQTRVLEQSDPARIKAKFDQSTFHGASLSPEHLRRRHPGHLPRLSEDGEITRFILALMRGETSLSDIARRVLAQFPTRFASFEDALARVRELSIKYSR